MALGFAAILLLVVIEPVVNHRAFGATASGVAKSEPMFDLAAIAASVPNSVPPFTPAEPVTVLPSPSTSSPGSVTRSPTHARQRPATHRPSSRPPATTRPPAAAEALTIGSTLGLELADQPGFRLRHRNFLARLDPIGGDSPRLDRHDSRFTVREGLAAAGCVSFESVNYPGHFLRHSNFVLRLDRRDRSRLFAADATFCPRSVRAGAAFVLESRNYPGRYLVARAEGVRLDRVTPDRATAFVVRPAV